MAMVLFTFLLVMVVRILVLAKTPEVLFVAIGKRFTAASFWAPVTASVIALGFYDDRLR